MSSPNLLNPGCKRKSVYYTLANQVENIKRYMKQIIYCPKIKKYLSYIENFTLCTVFLIQGWLKNKSKSMDCILRTIYCNLFERKLNKDKFLNHNNCI